MKPLYLFASLFWLAASISLQAQGNVYSTYINRVQINLRGGTINLGELTANFPASGYVVVHFDGECYAAVGDKIVLAASNDGNWIGNDGSVAIETSMPNFGRPFSHTRVYSVSAGAHTYYAVGENVGETDGSGMATVYGTLSLEYFPDTGTSTVKSAGFVFSGDVTDITVVKEQTVHVSGAGKIVVRFDGYITSSPADRIVLAASNTTMWSFNDGNVAVEAVNTGDVDENSFAHTRVYNVSTSGDYAYYALAQVYGKAGGNHMISANANLLVEFFPTAGPEEVLFTGFTLPTIDLNGQSTTLTSLTLDAPESGKVMLALTGYLTADPGYDIVLAASDNGDWSEGDGSLTLRALDLDQNRYSFSHTRTYNISSGSHTFYAVGEIFGGSGSKTADLFGQLTVKYIPNSATAVFDLSGSHSSFDLYPNPTHDNIHVTFTDAPVQQREIELLDLNGRLLKEYRFNAGEEINLDLSNLPSCLYWIKNGDVLKPVVRM